MPELWDRDDVADYLDIALNSVNPWLSRHGVKPASVGRSKRGGLGNLYDPDAIRQANRDSLGQGYRSDLETDTP